MLHRRRSADLNAHTIYRQLRFGAIEFCTFQCACEWFLALIHHLLFVCRLNWIACWASIFFYNNISVSTVEMLFSSSQKCGKKIWMIYARGKRAIEWIKSAESSKIAFSSGRRRVEVPKNKFHLEFADISQHRSLRRGTCERRREWNMMCGIKTQHIPRFLLSDHLPWHCINLYSISYTYTDFKIR